MVKETNQGVFEAKRAVIHRTGKGGFRDIDDDTTLVHQLREDPDEVIISTAGLTQGVNLEGESISGATTPDYYRYNVKRDRKKLIVKSSDRRGQFQFDDTGTARIAESVDRSTRERIYYHRYNNGDEWEEIYRYEITDTGTYGDEGVTFIDPLPDDNSLFYVLAHRGRDKRGVYLFDVDKKDFVEPVYVRKDVDVLNVRYEPDLDKTRQVSGFYYLDEGRFTTAFIDDRHASLQAGVDNAFPGRRNTFVCANNCKQMLVYSSSPQQPTEFYFIEDGRAQYLGGEYPLIEADMIGESRYVEYEAPDGRTIPGYVTLPAFGEAPYPLVVMPHGGPYVGEAIAYNEWVSVLSSHGYMVLRPQYRGSKYYGIAHYRAGAREWGLAMQDDMDAGARYLVEQGLADPDRMAMFGWSYGGYAALIAAAEEHDLWQCAISGAPVSDIQVFAAHFRQDRLQRYFMDDWAGIDPADIADEVDIPLLLIHGEVDQRVRIKHADMMVDQLENNRTTTRYVVLEDADHFSNTIDYHNQRILYEELFGWLHNECGMPTTDKFMKQQQASASN
jgi:dienelactone hydrolase